MFLAFHQRQQGPVVRAAHRASAQGPGECQVRSQAGRHHTQSAFTQLLCIVQVPVLIRVCPVCAVGKGMLISLSLTVLSTRY